MSQHFRDELISMDKELYMFSYVGISHVELFGAEFEFRFMRTFKCARMVDFEKVKRKAEVLDDGDDIKICSSSAANSASISLLIRSYSAASISVDSLIAGTERSIFLPPMQTFTFAVDLPQSGQRSDRVSAGKV